LFFIVNKTKSKVSIDDLGIILGPRQATDLDKRITRSLSESSKDLRKLSSKGIIDIRSKDKEAKKNKKEVVNDGISEKSLNNLKKDMMDEFKKGMREMKEDLKGNISGIGTGVSEEKLQEIVSQIAKAIKNNNVGQESLREIQEENPQIDGDVLASIHSMAVGKMTEDTTMSKINYKKEKIKSDSLRDSVSELEGLLGD